MSQIAHFYDLPLIAIQQGLLPASMPRRRLFRKPLYVFQEYLEKHGKNFDGMKTDGTWWLLILKYLKRFENIDMLEGDKGLLVMTNALSRYQGGAFTILTHQDKEEYLERIRNVKIDPSNVEKMLIEDGLSTPEKVKNDVFTDRRTWIYAHQRLVEILDSIQSDRAILTSVA